MFPEIGLGSQAVVFEGEAEGGSLEFLQEEGGYAGRLGCAGMAEHSGFVGLELIVVLWFLVPLIILFLIFLVRTIFR